MIGQGYLTNSLLIDLKKPRQWMKLYDMSSQHSLTLEKGLKKKDGNKVQMISIDLYKNSDGFIIHRCNIYEWSNNIKTDIHTFTLYYNSPTLLFALEILSGLREHYIRNGKLNGHMGTAIIKNLVGIESERFLM